MKRLILSTLIWSLAAVAASAQSYSINWHKVAGGGGTSSGGSYSVSGTIGQPDASGVMAGGSYSLTGGFWSMVAAVPVAGLPALSIKYVNPNSVVVSWPNTGSYVLQQKTSLTTGTWATSTNAVTTANSTSSITITPPAGSLFFRLAP